MFSVVNMVANGQTIAYASQALEVSENLIYCWQHKTEGKEKAAVSVISGLEVKEL